MVDLNGAVVVITGASSGIGRASAIEFARRGARLVIAARRAQALEETAQLCEREGASPLVVVTDVTHETDLTRLLNAALGVTGNIDVWVNNAGTTAFGLLDRVELSEHRRVLETNLFAPMRAAQLVAPIFERQRRGVMINVGSVLSKVGQPFVPSYVISKFALRGLSETLRTQFADMPNVHVCTLLPYAVETPHFDTAANHTALAPHPVPPVQDVDVVARALVDLAARPRRERYVPRIAALGIALHGLLPRPVERTLLHVLSSWHIGPERAPETEGTLLTAGSEPGRKRGRSAARGNAAELFAWIVRNFVGIMVNEAPVPGR